MTKTILFATALMFATSSLSFASLSPHQADVTVKAKTNTLQLEAKRSKKRVPGGSGCNSAHDRAEHPECRS